MSFDRDQMIAATVDGFVARILIVEHKGSAPRHAGTSMLVWADRMAGTIGGGALELRAIDAARRVLECGVTHVETVPLGPALGQCCGGSVSVLIERFDGSELPQSGDVFVRPVHAGTSMTLAVKRLQAQIRNQSIPAILAVIDGWIFEPVRVKNAPLWLYGAGHVGRAIVDVLDGLDVDVTWVDTALDRFPDGTRATTLVAQNPADAARHAPADADHLIMTYSHAFDLELCHQVLSQPHRSVGVIGSGTKRARFKSRLAKLGHSRDVINGLICPIGDPNLGNEPKAIAIGVAAQLMNSRAVQAARGRKLNDVN
tara:strand:+ start:5433 stop:6371 length:939 start_codon:yes stop_codon:yes gene_type:complete